MTDQTPLTPYETALVLLRKYAAQDLAFRLKLFAKADKENPSRVLADMAERRQQLRDCLDDMARTE